MNSLHVKYLLVGGGLASSAAAEAIRQHDARGSVLLVGQEVNRPYHRPSLSRDYLLRRKDRHDITTFPHGWMKEHGVELRTGRRVANLDTGRATAALDNGEEVTYDSLLLAIGASPKTLKLPGADLPNIFYLRTIDDADRLHHAVEKALRAGLRHPKGVGRGRCAVVGGGLLGTELAATFTEMGLHVDLVVGAAHPWHRFVGQTTGAFIRDHLERHNVALHSEGRAEHFEGDGRVQRVVLSSGDSIELDFVVGCVGVTPNRKILRNTPIAAETAILVDSHCRTSVPNVYAAGDCAAVLDPLFGKHRLIDHWENAQITGSIAGTNMAGVEAKYEAVSHFTSEVFGMQIAAWGERRQVHHRLLRGAAGAAGDGSFVEFGIASDGRVAQVVKVGTGGEDPNALSLCVAKRLQTNGLEEQLKDPTQDLASLVGE
jgi:NADPH-dependent 2,4-dienoyl-CoA reductase/sulfur reductase-like enzyme